MTARETSTGIEAHVEVKPSYGLTDDEILGMLKSSFEFAQDDAAARSLAEARVEAGRVIEALGNALDEDGAALLAESDIGLLRDALEKLARLAEEDDPRAITDGTEMLGRASEDFATLRMDAAVRKALAGRQIADLDQEI